MPWRKKFISTMDSPSAKLRAKNITTILPTFGFSFSKWWFGLVLLVWFWFSLIRFFLWIWEYGLKKKGEVESFDYKNQPKTFNKNPTKKKHHKTLIARKYPQIHKASGHNIRDQSVPLSTRQIVWWHRLLVMVSVSEFCHWGMILSSFLAKKWTA